MKKFLGLFAVPLGRAPRLAVVFTVLALFTLGSATGESQWWCPINSFGPGESISCVWWNASNCGGMSVCVMEICFDLSTQEDDIGIDCMPLAFACAGGRYSGCT